MKLLPTLIPDWKKAYKLSSVQVAALGAFASAMWELLTDEQRTMILSKLGLGPIWSPITLIFIGVIFARIKSQQPKPPKESDPETPQEPKP